MYLPMIIQMPKNTRSSPFVSGSFTRAGQRGRRGRRFADGSPAIGGRRCHLPLSWTRTTSSLALLIVARRITSTTVSSSKMKSKIRSMISEAVSSSPRRGKTALRSSALAPPPGQARGFGCLKVGPSGCSSGRASVADSSVQPCPTTSVRSAQLNAAMSAPYARNGAGSSATLFPRRDHKPASSVSTMKHPRASARASWAAPHADEKVARPPSGPAAAHFVLFFRMKLTQHSWVNEGGPCTLPARRSFCVSLPRTGQSSRVEEW
mmetsp:Transcript_2016/g.5644  ORF Transcript_2016/g.5644 Transcript_2016/m.5644 type:complete len:264 (-) Transcript_2016:848-1639(-)